MKWNEKTRHTHKSGGANSVQVMKVKWLFIQDIKIDWLSLGGYLCKQTKRPILCDFASRTFGREFTARICEISWALAAVAANKVTLKRCRSHAHQDRNCSKKMPLWMRDNLKTFCFKTLFAELSASWTFKGTVRCGWLAWSWNADVTWTFAEGDA